jgi:nucleotide-binding universal stress UspA family protein
MFNRILVATDGSPTSNRALDNAIEPAKDQGAPVIAASAPRRCA